ncbi:hypothetical protein ACLB2K_000425 [Fragaria x ananassa]
MPATTGLSGSDLEVGLVDFIRGEGARWLSGSNQKVSSSIRRRRLRAGDVEVESEHIKVKSEDTEVEAELEVVVDGIRRSRGVNVKVEVSSLAGSVEVEVEASSSSSEKQIDAGDIWFSDEDHLIAGFEAPICREREGESFR